MRHLLLFPTLGSQEFDVRGQREGEVYTEDVTDQVLATYSKIIVRNKTLYMLLLNYNLIGLINASRT
jgi:hypothetical protein